MDWIRRNWPDLLIGFALLAVISGIVATLLTGGSFLPLGRGAQTTSQSPAAPQQSSTAPEQPAAPGAPDTLVDPLNQPDNQVSELPLLPQIGGDPADPGTATEPDGLADGPVDPFSDLPAEPDDQPAVVPLRPGDNGDAAPAAPAGAPAAPQAAAAPQASPEAPPATPAQTAPQQVTTSGEAPSEAVPYTVGVGAFRSAENANRQADVFRQAGYPVVVAQQDDLTVILLGPYASQSEADRVRAAVASGGFDVSPIVYTYQGEDGAGAAEAPAASPAPAATPAPAAEPPAASPQQPTTPAAAPTATQAGRYLQVGAYSSSENAGAQADVLTGLGYAVVQQQDGQLIRVLVGPYAEPELGAAQNRLAAQGIDSVPR